MREYFEQALSIFWIIVHNRWIVLIAAFVISISGWVFVEFIPDKFEVETKIYFDTKTVLKPLLKGLAVDNTIREDSAILMRKTLTSRPNLLKVAQETEMDLKAETPEELEKVLVKLALNIGIKAISIKGARNQELYSITYTDNDPKLAKEVVESILSIFIESVLGSSRKDSDKAEKFLDEKILEYQKKLEAAEERLKIFKQKNPTLSQENDSSFFKRLNHFTSQLDEANLSLREETNKNLALKKQLDELKIAHKNNSSSVKTTTPQAEKSELQVRIENMQIKLDDLLLQFTDKHPDVLSTKRALEGLKEKLKSEQATSSTPVTDSTSQVNQSSLQESVFFQELKLLISASDSEVAALNARISEYQNKIDEMNKMISVIPEIEAELVRLNRDYKIVKQTYDNLVERKASAEISREAEQTGGELQFKVVEPPRIPLKPIGPNRFLFSSIVLLFALVAAAALAWFIEQLNPSFYSIKQLEETTGQNVYGSISMNWSNQELRRKKIGAAFYFVIFLGLFGIYGVLLLHYDVLNLGKIIG